jgi:(1->4)-alpha-D-glucan 1-alpha-D-glucosylmutase
MQRRATYRVQLRPGFGFDEAAAQAPYMASLGISHVYCSPYFQAAAGSTHGYDVVDPTRISEDLGGQAAYQRFTAALAAAGLTQLLDIVPNHMSIADRRNRWWWDVLADGQGSPYAGFFDIDWEVDEPRLRHRVLLPVLGDQVGRVLEDGEISIVREDGSLLIAYFDSRFPLSVESQAELFSGMSVAAAVTWPARVSALPAGRDRAERRLRFEQRRHLEEALSALLTDERVAEALDRVLDQHNTDIGALDHVLNEQHHRLARWQTATEEVNYRRFFDINTLVALRIEDPVVFEEATALTVRLVAAGDVDGLRVDHIDGLRRPLEYADRLRAATSAEAWLLAEKITARGEQPPRWALDGTSGYDFLAIVNGLFVDPLGRDRLEALHTEVTGNPNDFELYARDGKREILRSTLRSDVERVTSVLARICDAYPSHRDHTHSELSDAVVEMIAAIPVYRTYVNPRAGGASDIDAGIIRGAAARTAADNPDLDARLLDLIADLFVVGEPEDMATSDTADTPSLQSDLVQRMQQLCAATTAKGVEDTACYRHLVLVSLNEVGDSPAHFGVSADELHQHNLRTQADRPQALLTTSTHDTKRSEDVRARIDVLSEIPDEWATVVRRWTAMNGAHRRGEWPDTAMEYLLYQTAVGAWPLSVERAVAYMGKAAREAKQHTDWLRPDEAYDAALAAFVGGVLSDERFTADLEGFVATVAPYGRINSLATTLLKLTSPGVPDIYQGTELWDLSLVDPDNRRPVDYTLRNDVLETSRSAPPAASWSADPGSGAAKLALIASALALRERRPEAFDQRGEYVPRRAHGEFADDVVAFTRGDPPGVMSVVQRRSLRRRGNWGETMIMLPDGAWRNLADGTERVGEVRLADLLAAFPLALLERAA